MQHRARKRFGQNFLSDDYVIAQIIHLIHPAQNDNFLEIGPGLGALTFQLLDLVPHMSAIELDRDLYAHLQEKTTPETLTLVNEDVLKVDITQFGQDLRIIGNLPYNISTPIIMHLLNSGSSIKNMCFMLQKEVVERMTASPNTKAYGRLSVALQYLCDVTPQFTVPPEAFSPRPKVTSQLVTIRPYVTFPHPKTCFLTLQSVLRKAFATRRKTLKNNLKGILSDQDFSALNIDPVKRPETLTVGDFINITEHIIKTCPYSKFK